MADRLERLTNLVATLLDTRRPLPLEELVDLVPGYPPDKASYRRQFERDKDTLRGIGIPVQTEPIDALGPEVGYRIHPDQYYLPDLGLAAEEQAALHVAVTAVRLEGGAGPEALWKLGGLEGEAATAVAALPTVPELPALFDAYRERATVTFSYRDERRRLDPWGIVFRRGHWYVVGHDHDRADERAFRIDRVEGPVETGEAGTVEPPADVDPAGLLRDDPWRFGDEDPIAARVLVDAPQAPGVVHQVGEHSVVERRADGSVVLGLPVTNVAAFRSFVVGLLDGAEVLDPPELRDDVVAWLGRMATTA
ncbi:MAG TPA: WYL domain-containing protein [Acidimicrobiia bacterium]|nr:WYL domain-containing protein [Acidimicrobiia bacterium]